MALFYTAIRRDSVSLLRFHFLSYIRVFSCEISLVCRLKYPYRFFLPIFVQLIPVLFLLFIIIIIII